MQKIIRCECGYVVHGSSDQELVVNATAHMREMHPDIVDSVRAEDLLGMAEIVA
ncbi:MAG TPA: hypothetical protein VFK52_06290 [Nocardioidaceae bacterium]|nr:hypothetical protein [Nocardioidaceae bacterium]